MMKETENVSYKKLTEDEIKLRTLIFTIWDGKWLILLITFIFSSCAVIYALNQPNIYRSEVLLAPVEDEASGGLSGLASQFGGLASLAGVNFGGKASLDNTKIAIEVMKSRKFTSQFITEHGILPELMASQSWKRKDNELLYEQDLFDSKSRQWVRKAQEPSKSKPSMQEAYEAFSKILVISSDKTSGLIKVSLEHISPHLAQQWVTWLVEDINKVMKERDVKEARKSTEFLEKQLRQTNITDIKTVLYKLVEEQAKTIMFAEVRDEYVFKTIDPALVPEKQVKPKKSLICALGFIIGLISGTAYVLVRNYAKFGLTRS